MRSVALCCRSMHAKKHCGDLPKGSAPTPLPSTLCKPYTLFALHIVSYRRNLCLPTESDDVCV